MMKGKLIVEFNLTVFLQLYAKQNKTLFMTSSKNTTWWILRQVLLHHASKLYFTLACRKCIDLYRRETGKDFVCLCTVDQNCKTGLHTITVSLQLHGIFIQKHWCFFFLIFCWDVSWTCLKVLQMCWCELCELSLLVLYIR